MLVPLLALSFGTYSFLFLPHEDLECRHASSACLSVAIVLISAASNVLAPLYALMMGEIQPALANLGKECKVNLHEVVNGSTLCCSCCSHNNRFACLQELANAVYAKLQSWVDQFVYKR